MTVAPAPTVDTDEFVLTGDLPSGTTILEASAGTGKTFAIAGLVLRYVVERDIPLAELLVVTFTRAATAELRDRVRRRFVDAADHLGDVVGGADPAHRDPVLAHLAAGVDAAELRRRHERASRALADFDAATISTIHGFCQQVLRSVGLTLDVDPDAELLTDQSDIVEAVVDDLLVRAAVDRQVTEVTRVELLQIADRVVANPDARLLPDADGSDAVVDGDAVDIGALRVELAGELRRVLHERKRRRRQLSYDDLVTCLRDAVTDPATGREVVAALRERYQVALIDEFQDTDPVQWDILRRAFADPDATLVLIGDPKQAIYSFRGADVHAYLAAVDAAGQRLDLRTNWRSDGPLLHALDVLLDGATFGDPRIRYRTVRAADDHRDARLHDAGAPLRLRWVPRSHQLRSSRGDISAPAARQHIADDVAVQAVELLSSGTTIHTGGGPAGGEARTVTAGDLAVLVRTNAEAELVHRALREAHVPAIINGVGSVFDTPAATEWRQLLEALEQPANGSRARAAALTSFLDWDADRLADAGDDDLADLHGQLHVWAQVLRDRGVASLVRTITVTTDLPSRLLGVVGGERHLTDLEHLGQLLHRAVIDEELGPASLTAWLTQAITAANDEQVPPDERARRLESDDRAVQILTVHRSKGLQYPVVFAPFLWSPGWLNQPILTFHDAGGRALDIGGNRKGDEDYDANKEQADAEHAGEQLRLLYVALTRAEHQAVVWWAPSWQCGKSGLGRVLFARSPDGTLDTTRAGQVPSDDRCRDRLDALAGRADGTISIEETDPRPTVGQLPSDAFPTPPLNAARLGRDLDRAWHRTSYSAITAEAHAPTSGPVAGTDATVGNGPLVGSEPDEPVKDDEALLPADGPPPDTTTAATSAPTADASGATDGGPARAELDRPLPLGDVPGGTEFGTFVHAVLEDVDFAAPDLRATLRELTDEQLTWRGTTIGDPAVLADGLGLAIETPLGPLAGGRRLRDLDRDDRLDELDFELPLDPRRTGTATVAGIAELLRTHLPTDDPLAGYADELDASGIDRELRGYLTGSIDLVLRIADDDGVRRYLIADHKTNRLGDHDGSLTAGDYTPAALADAMVHGHYPLQALLYQVALHRYLRWRVPDYDPDAALGGALYLFLRGMAGPDTPVVDGQPCGVFAWSPPSALIVAISDLLDGGAR